jgi:demethylmenaquinone methyltransferase/2-methoxy-6-polyprenyl-1,4-benzoquinol methylase
MPLADKIATPDGKRRYVRALFTTIADRYDFITVALSYGQDRRWKRRVADLAQPRRDLRVLDLATGTGDIAFALAARGAGVVGLDITQRMITLARAKNPGRRPVRFIVGDMTALPFPTASFDVVTIGYGLRNVPDLAVAIAEASRVLKAGGRLISLDFNRPANRALRALYLLYLTIVGSALGWLLHRDPDTYRYIPASLRSYPGADGVSRMLADRGFSRVQHQPVLGGLMSIHLGFRD